MITREKFNISEMDKLLCKEGVVLLKSEHIEFNLTSPAHPGSLTKLFFHHILFKFLGFIIIYSKFLNAMLQNGCESYFAAI